MITASSITANTVAVEGTNTFTLQVPVVSSDDEPVEKTGACFSLYTGEDRCFSVSTGYDACYRIKYDSAEGGEQEPLEDIDITPYGAIEVYSIHCARDTLYVFCNYKPSGASVAKLALVDFLISENIEDGISIESVYRYLYLDAVSGLDSGYRLFGYTTESNLKEFVLWDDSTKDVLVINPVGLSVSNRFTAPSNTLGKFLSEGYLSTGHADGEDCSDVVVSPCRKLYAIPLDGDGTKELTSIAGHTLIGGSVFTDTYAYYGDVVISTEDGYGHPLYNGVFVSLGITTEILHLDQFPAYAYVNHGEEFGELDNSGLGYPSTLGSKFCYDGEHISYSGSGGIYAAPISDIGAGETTDVAYQGIWCYIYEESYRDHSLTNNALIIVNSAGTKLVQQRIKDLERVTPTPSPF